MKVAISNSRSGWGGASAVALALGRGLAARGHGVRFLTRPGSPLTRRAREAGFGADAVLRGHDFPPLPATRAALALRRWGADALVSGLEKDLRLGGLGARLVGVPVLALGVSAPGRRRPETWLWRRVPHHIVANSEATRRRFLTLKGVRPEDVSVIHNGIDLAPFRDADPAALDLPADSFVVGFVGRITPDKGIEHLVEAWPRIRGQVPAARLLVVGRGGLEDTLRARTAGDPTVRWLGFRRDVAGVLAACDVAAVPSPEEAFGLVAVEAMAGGVPVVGTRAGGLPEVVRDGVEGVLVPPADPAALAVAVVRLARDPELRRRLGAAGRARAGEFSCERMLDGFEAALRRLVEARGRGG